MTGAARVYRHGPNGVDGGDAPVGQFLSRGVLPPDRQSGREWHFTGDFAARNILAGRRDRGPFLPLARSGEYYGIVVTSTGKASSNYDVGEARQLP